MQQTGTCNLAQLALVARLADQYLDGMLINRALTHHFVDACLNRLEEARYAHPRGQKNGDTDKLALDSVNHGKGPPRECREHIAAPSGGTRLPV